MARRRSGLSRPPRRNRGLAVVLAALAVTAGCFVILESRIRPVVEDMASYQAKITAMKCINDAMSAELASDEVDYGDIVTVTQNATGDVTSIQSNMVEINHLKTRVTETIIQELAKEENQVVEIPAGTLLGSQITSGWGPTVRIKVIPTGYVQTRVYNQFISAGINQTLHRIMLETSVEMVAIVPGYAVYTSTATDYCIAETVIVGSIPEGYTNIEGDDSSTISKFNDYRADS